jgi:hypothetical protein
MGASELRCCISSWLFATIRSVSVPSATAIEADEEILESLDSQFFSYPDNLTELLFAFVAENQDEFGKVPE